MSELRVHVGPGYRIYFARLGERRILLLTGGTKRSQAADIRFAGVLLLDARRGDDA
ncbi:MAG: hypothetical protein FJ363_13420 [Gemmatimonadetes bacterium]|nr:hypothetical protein [Gemmatimonadota bacterium]